MKFNKDQYLKFKKKNQLNELTVKEKKEFSNMGLLMENEVFWNNRNHYLQLINDFLDSKIDSDQFTGKFGKLRADNLRLSIFKHSYLFLSQNNFEVTCESEGFTTIIDDLFIVYDLHDPDIPGFELNASIISDEGLKYYLKVICRPEIYKYIKEQEDLRGLRQTRELAQKKLIQNEHRTEVQKLKNYSILIFFIFLLIINYS